MVLDRILKIESDSAAMKVVLSDFLNQQLSVQQNFNMLDGKLNELKTDAKYPRIERLEILSKIKNVATNAHPESMRHLIKRRIDIKTRKQDPIQYSATVTIKLVESDIFNLKRRFNTLDMKVEAKFHE